MRERFDRSPLIRLLAASGGDGIAPAPAGQDFAERLGSWLSVADAITLRTAQQSQPKAQPGRLAGDAAPSSQELAAELQRVRTTLTRSILATEPVPTRKSRADHAMPLPSQTPSLPVDPAAEFALLHQRFNEQQRRMEMSVDALRAHARDVLSRASPALARLAALDGVMDKLLGGREQQALSTVPAHLKRRFEALRRQAEQEDEHEAETLFTADTGHQAPRFPDWLQQLAAEFDQALLAELDLRLQPVAGLVEALQGAH